MPVDVSLSAYSGLLIPDPQLCSPDAIWDAESAFSQTGPSPGVPEPLSTGQQMLLRSHGDQDADSSLDVFVVEGGVPGTARIAWKRTDDSVYRGRDAPTVITGREVISHISSGSVGSQAQSALLSLRSGKALLAHYYSEVATLLQGVKIRVRSTTGTWGSPATVVTWSSLYSHPAYPAAVQLDDGSIILYIWTQSFDLDYAGIAAYRSTDEGDTWTLISQNVLPEDYSTEGSPSGVDEAYTPSYLCAAHMDGQVVLFVHLQDNYSLRTHTERLHQYASIDGGQHFSSVFKSPPGETWCSPAVCSDGDLFHVAWLGADEEIYVAAIPSAFYSIQYVGTGMNAAADTPATRAWAIYAASPERSTSLKYAPAIVAGDDGVVYLYQDVFLGSSPLGIACYRRDPADGSWSETGAGPADPHYGTVWNSNDSGTWLQEIAACWHRGQVLMVSTMTLSPATTDSSLIGLYLGGWSTVTMPSSEFARSDRTQSTWAATYIGMELPEDCGWTAAGTGSAAMQTSGAARITTSLAQRSYSQTVSHPLTGGVIVRARVAPVSAGGDTQIFLNLDLDDGSNRYRARIYFGTGLLSVYDQSTSTLIASESMTLTSGIEVIVAFAGNKGSLTDEGHMAIWYRLAPQGDFQDREWTPWVQTTAISYAASAAASSTISFGHTLGSTAVSDWHEIHYAYSGVLRHYAGVTEDGGAGFFSGQDNPDDLFCPPVGPGPLYLSDGVSVSAAGGVAVRGDAWTIATRYRYAIERIFGSVSPSPRQGWRALEDDDEETIALRYGTGGHDTYFDSDILGIGLYNTNIGEFTVHGYDVGVGWVHLLDGDARVAYGLDWEQKGTLVRADDAAPTAIFLHRNEVAGGTLVLGGTPHKITANSSGLWDLPSAGQVTTLHVPAITPAATAGSNAEIWSPNVLALIYLNGRRFSAYRITIPIQATADGDHRLGTVVIGPVVPFVAPPSWGTSTETTAGTELDTARDGSRKSRVVAPSRRTRSIAWSDGLDQSDVERAAPDVAYATDATGAEAVGVWGDQGYLLEGILSQLDGAHNLIVHIPKIPFDSDELDGVSLPRRHQHMLCRMVSPVRIETIQGDEGVDEVIRIASIDLEEEI